MSMVFMSMVFQESGESLVMYDHINRSKKSFDKIRHPFLTITLRKLAIEGNLST